MEIIISEMKKYITAKGIKMNTISKKIGISEATVYNIMMGKRRLMTNEFFDICNALEVSPNFFYQKFMLSKEVVKNASSDLR